jgi:hypothetical protein
MPGTSSYIQISRYALLEYQYNSELIQFSGTVPSAGGVRLENKYTGSYQFLNNDHLTVEKGEEVDLIVSHITEIGINVIINEQHKGLLYKDEVYDDAIRTGDSTKDEKSGHAFKSSVHFGAAKRP